MSNSRDSRSLHPEFELFLSDMKIDEKQLRAEKEHLLSQTTNAKKRNAIENYFAWKSYVEFRKQKRTLRNCPDEYFPAYLLCLAQKGRRQITSLDSHYPQNVGNQRDMKHLTTDLTSLREEIQKEKNYGELATPFIRCYQPIYSRHQITRAYFPLA